MVCVTGDTTSAPHGFRYIIIIIDTVSERRVEMISESGFFRLMNVTMIFFQPAFFTR